MQHTFQLHDLVYLWGDKDKDFLKIISITHYPESKEPAYELWVVGKNCQLRTGEDNLFYKHQLLPVPVSDLARLYDVTQKINDAPLPIEDYASDHVDEDAYSDQERDVMIAELVAESPNNFQIWEYEINPDVNEIECFQSLPSDLDAPHYAHQLQQYHRLIYGEELI